MGTGLWEVFILAHVILVFAYYFAIRKGKNKGSLCLTPLGQCGQEGAENRVTKGPGAGEEGCRGIWGVPVRMGT